MDQHEAMVRMQAFVHATRDAFPGRSWKVQDGPTSEACRTESGASGTAWTYTVTTTDRGSIDADLRILEEFWKSKGVEFRVLPSAGPNDPLREVIGHHPDLDSIEFVHSRYKDGITARSLCGDGTVV